MKIQVTRQIWKLYVEDINVNVSYSEQIAFNDKVRLVVNVAFRKVTSLCSVRDFESSDARFAAWWVYVHLLCLQGQRWYVWSCSCVFWTHLLQSVTNNHKSLNMLKNVPDFWTKWMCRPPMNTDGCMLVFLVTFESMHNVIVFKTNCL